MNDQPIKTGSIVAIRHPSTRTGVQCYVGIIVHNSNYDPGLRKILVPGIGVLEAALTNCHNVTGVERKLYFKNVLLYGK